MWYLYIGRNLTLAEEPDAAALADVVLDESSMELLDDGTRAEVEAMLSNFGIEEKIQQVGVNNMLSFETVKCNEIWTL